MLNQIWTHADMLLQLLELNPNGLGANYESLKMPLYNLKVDAMALDLSDSSSNEEIVLSTEWGTIEFVYGGPGLGGPYHEWSVVTERELFSGVNHLH